MSLLNNKKIVLVSHADYNIYLFRSTLIAMLVEMGAEVIAAVPAGNYRRSLEKIGARVVHYPFSLRRLSPLNNAVSVRRLGSAIRFLDPDIIHSFTHQPNMFARFAGGAQGIVVNSVTGLGTWFVRGGIRSALVRFMICALYALSSGRCKALVFQNEDDMKYFHKRRLAGRARTLLVRGSGVDLQRFRPGAFAAGRMYAVRKRFGISTSAVVCTMAGRLIKHKGVYEFLEAARMLEEKCPQAVFLLVGSPDEGNASSVSQGDLRDYASCRNVVFSGWQEDMSLVWALSDIAVNASYREGLPVALQEALASGLPVVTTDAAGCRDIVDDGVNGFSVPVGDSRALARAIERLVAERNMRLSMGVAGRRKAEREFCAVKRAGEYVSLYETLLVDARA